MPEEDLRAELERSEALLAQARLDRDRLQEQVLRQEEQLRLVRRIPGLRTAYRARRYVPARPGRTDSAPTVAPGPVRPGRYIDVTVLQDPARTGIARVTTRLARELGYGLVVMRGGVLTHDDAFAHEIGPNPGAPSPDGSLPGQPLAFGPDVVVLNTAIQLDATYPQWQEQVRRLRRAGGRFVQVVHDLLPVTLPDFFDYGMRHRFPDWLDFITGNSDLILTDSAATRSDLLRWRPDCAVAVRAWPLGSDPLPPPQHRDTGKGSRRLLTVGTVEPRKAIDTVVRAAETLRADGRPVDLTVVGHRGWADEGFTRHLERLRAEPWFDWIEDADDQRLADEYARADLLVAASRGEGYGLPIAEARAAGLPVVARDIPVFRELLGPDGRYFREDTELAAVIDRALAAGGSTPRDAAAAVSWREAAGFVDAAIGDLA